MGNFEGYLEGGRSDLCPQPLITATQSINDDICDTFSDNKDRLDLIPGVSEALQEVRSNLIESGIPENIMEKLVNLFKESYLLNVNNFDILVKGIIAYKNEFDESDNNHVKDEENREKAYNKVLADIKIL